MFPEDHELVAFFEAEPDILDPDVASFYNTLAFRTVRGEIKLRCELSPSYGQLALCLTVAGHDLLDVDIRRVIGVRLENRAGKELMLATVQRQDGQEMFVLQLKPYVRVALSTGT